MGKCLRFEKVIKLFSSFQNLPPLALNIKSDGLHQHVKDLLLSYKVTNYFVFDMSIPDTLNYMKSRVRFFTRLSDYELQPIFNKEAAGLWLDEFKGHWINERIIKQYRDTPICIVSPELHHRTYAAEWQEYKKIELKLGCENLMICTDFPDKAQEFFNGKN